MRIIEAVTATGGPRGANWSVPKDSARGPVTHDGTRAGLRAVEWSEHMRKGGAMVPEEPTCT